MRASRRLMLVLGVATVATAACAGGDTPGEAVSVATAVPHATVAPPATAGAAAGSSPAGDSELYVTATAGRGVSVRDDCADAARAGGAIPDGARVVVEAEGSGRCIGWTLVVSGDTESWVRSQYLATTNGSPASPAVAASGLAAPAAPRTPPAPVDRTIAALAWEGHHIPLDQLVLRPPSSSPSGIVGEPDGYSLAVTTWCDAPSWHAAGPTVVTTAGVEIAPPYPRFCGFGKLGTREVVQVRTP